MKLIILISFCVGALAGPMFQALSVKDDGSYDFSYETGKEGGSHSRTEKRNPDGVVTGKFSYEDPNGAIREVSYRADDSGYVANGDVSVEGAPKGQFPAAPEHQVAPEDDKDGNKQKSEDDETPQASELHPDEESHHDDIHNLSLDEPSANDPPEAFPEGYFLQKFTGLRRFPEPTKEEPTTTSEPSTDAPEPQAFPAIENQSSQEAMIASDAADEDHNKISREPTSEMDMLMHPRPFQGFHSAQWTSSMFHQPVYVFSYQQPESFGYYYYY